MKLEIVYCPRCRATHAPGDHLARPKKAAAVSTECGGVQFPLADRALESSRVRVPIEQARAEVESLPLRCAGSDSRERPAPKLTFLPGDFIPQPEIIAANVLVRSTPKREKKIKVRPLELHMDELKAQAAKHGLQLVPKPAKEKRATYMQEWRAADKLGLSVAEYRARKAEK